MKKNKKLIILLLIIFSTTSLFSKERKELLFYIGITMVKPVNELAKNFEKIHKCKINILQGGSQDLYNSIKMSKKGDIYLPGSLVYRERNLKDGILLDGKFVGYNKLSFLVKKGNPINIKASLDELTNENLRVVLGNASSGSVGNATKKLLKSYGNYKEAMLNAVFLAPDSRNLNKAIIEDKADLIVNWHATSFWGSNLESIDAITLDESLIKKAKLVFNLLSFSENKELSRKFLEYAASKEGREIFHKYGFLDRNDLEDFDKVTF